jgi:hypothetical protein
MELSLKRLEKLSIPRCKLLRIVNTQPKLTPRVLLPNPTYYLTAVACPMAFDRGFE